MNTNRTNTSSGRRVAISALLMMASFCCIAGVLTTDATAEEAELEVVKVESTSFVVVRQSFKNGERIEWTVHELGSPFSFTPKSAMDYAEDPRFRTIKRGIAALEKLDKFEDPKKVEVPSTGTAVTSGDLEGEMSLLFVVHGDSCFGYSTKEKLTIKSIRKLSWTTFE